MSKKLKTNILLIIAVLLVFALAGCQATAPKNENADKATVQTNSSAQENTNVQEESNVINGAVDGINLKIKKADITEKASFYSYEEAGVYMEVMAVKASDGSIRTALNTCQVCFDSGRGYYKQDGDVVVCQNCGNVFGIDDIEVVKGGCNPVPIMKENKSEDDEFITISGEFLADNAGYFEKWKR